MTKGRIIGIIILAAWLSVHGYFIWGCLSKWEKTLTPNKWKYFSTGAYQEFSGAGFPDASIKYPKEWMMREGATKNPKEDIELYFYVSPYEQIFSRMTALGKYPYGNPSLQDVHNEALKNLRKKFSHFSAGSEPSFYENKEKQSVILMTEFQGEVSRLLTKPVKIYGIVVSYDGLSYGAYENKRPAYFVAISREKYYSRIKKIFLEMVGSIGQ